MRSWGFLLSRRWLGFAVVVALLASLAWWLGEWQFGRLEDRHERNAVFERNLAAAPLRVTDVLSADREVPASSEWRRVSATGRYDAQRTVVVRYQTREGTAGVDVVVPLVLPDGTGVLIDRGWLPSANSGATVAELPAPPPGEVEIIGWVRRDATGDSTAVTDAPGPAAVSTRAVSSKTIGPGVGLELLRGFVVLERESPQPGVSLAAPELPDPGSGPHFFYGLQWWFFGALAVGGFGYLAYDERRGPRRRRRDLDATTPG